MRDKPGIVVGSVLLIGLALLAFQAWWFWPEELPGGKLLDKVVRKGKGYSLIPKRGITLSRIVNLGVLEGYSPERHYEFQEEIEHRPSKFVEGKGRHYYVEYQMAKGRIQFHNEFSEDHGAGEWIEYLPTSLELDDFLKSEVANLFDVQEEDFAIYIKDQTNSSYMTISGKKGKVQMIFWSWYVNAG